MPTDPLSNDLVSKRPASITVFAVLHLVFAFFQFCGLFNSLGMAVLPDDGTNPVVAYVREIPAYVGYMLVSIPIGLAVMAGLITAGIGLFKNKVWSRTLSNAVAWTMIGWVLVGIVVNLVLILLPSLENFHPDASEEETLKVGIGVVGVCFAPLGMIYPVCVLIFLNRQRVKDYLVAHRSPTDEFGRPRVEPWEM